MEVDLETNHGMIFAYCAQKMAAIRRSFYSLSRIPGNLVSILFLSTSSPPTTEIPDTPPPSSSSSSSSAAAALDLEAGELEGQVEHIDLQPAGQVVAVAAAAPAVPDHHVNLPPHQYDWTAMVIGFCFTSAVEIALLSLQPQIKLSLLIHLLSLAMLFAFASVFVANFISPNFPTCGHVLILVSKVWVLAAFFFAITVPFTLSLKLVSWSIFGICLLSVVHAAVANGRVHHA